MRLPVHDWSSTLRRLALHGWLVATLSALGGGVGGAAPVAPPPGQSPRDAQAGSQVAPVTFAKDIAPIVFQQCAACHRPGGSAPFSLLSYADVRPRAREIVDAVTRRAMPPWAPEPGYGEFSRPRQLTEPQIATFRRWLDAGGPSGDLRAMPSPPDFKDGWQLGQPDLVLKLAQPFRLPPGGPDRLRNFVIPIPISARRYVKAWEFQAGNLRVVHHSMMLVDHTRESRTRDDADPEPGYEGLVPLSARMPDGYFVDWTPGQVPYVAPDHMAWTLEQGSDLVLTLHLRPTGSWETVDASVGLYFGDAPPTLTPTMIRLSRQDIDIPPGDSRYAISDSYVLPVDVDAFDIKPHAHSLAREMRVFADLPDGTRRWLIYIKRWDFHWQDSYRYAVPITLPAGSRITMEYTYDNSAGNRANTSSPPRRITFGQETSDEMGDLWLQVLPRDPATLALLDNSMRAKMLPQDIAGYEMMLKANPDSLPLHQDLSGLYLEAGNFRNAAREAAEAIRLKPGVAAPHYSLGYNLLQLREYGQAQEHFRQALAIDPKYTAARDGLGLALWGGGQHQEAIDFFREGVRLSPRSPEAYYNVAVVLQWNGQIDEALAQYDKAVEIDPSHVDARFAAALIHVERREAATAVASLRRVLEARQDWLPAQIPLTWLLASSPDAAVRDVKAALALAERSSAVTGQRDPKALDALAAALAANGQFERAVDVAQRALGLLGVNADPTRPTAAPPPAEAVPMRARLEQYRKHQAFIDNP